ncbi:site-specific integrase [Alicyclobacillus sendaiensis]|uniref:Site-specific integrase n=1 Tax=Alicyclobacillus sendaiensis PA2 TaxID=3029425 RepID=A0ABT6Y213_ALISE|nr:site-specific integrase [Alicyclobacillus sendaiensis]MDI9261270.1 site-specific integrase [Alicyclobacillus sendaiensis PA2]
MNGHVTKKGSKYYVVIELERDANGKRRRKWFGGYKTKKEAQAALVQKLHELQTGQFIEESDITIAEFLQQWLEHKRSQVRPATLRSYEWHIRRHILPYIGHIKVSKLTPSILQNLYITLQKAPRHDGKPGSVSNRSILHAHLVLHEALERAVRWGIIPRNVCDLVDPPRPQKVDIQVWDIEHVNRFLLAARNDRYYIAFLLAITTGMRKGEILGLRWIDIDFASKLITVRQNLSFVHGQIYFLEPKTARGRRAVALSDPIIEALKRHREIQDAERHRAGVLYEDHGLVVQTELGHPVTPRALDRSWYSLLKQCDVPKIRFHDLRHTHATLLLKQGVHPKIVSERLGHANIGITLDTYSHVLPNLQQSAIEQLSELISVQDDESNANCEGRKRAEGDD